MNRVSSEGWLSVCLLVFVVVADVDVGVCCCILRLLVNAIAFDRKSLLLLLNFSYLSFVHPNFTRIKEEEEEEKKSKGKRIEEEEDLKDKVTVGGSG